MTIDQDTPVAASQPATETPSQEAPKPRRTTRAKAKTTAKAPSAKSSTAKAAETAPTGQSAESQPPRASAEEPKAAAKSTARTGKTSRTSTARSKKTETPPDTEAAASEASKPAAKPKATRTTAKSGATGRSAKAATAGKTKAAAAKTAKTNAEGTPTKEADGAAAKAPTAKKAAAKTTRSRSTKSGTTAKNQATAKPSASAAAAEAAPATGAPTAATESAPKAAMPAEAATTAAKAAPQHAAHPAAESFPAGKAETAPAAAAEAAPEAASAKEFSPAQAERPATAAPQQTADAATATAARESGADKADESAADAADESPLVGDEPAEDAPRRKNRRGRRGGRGRNRKKDQNGQDAPLADATPDNAEKTAAPAAPEEGEAETRPQAEAKPAAPRKQGRPEPAQNAKAAKAPAESSTAKGKRRMFISVLPGEQVEVALAEDGQLLEYYLDMLHQRKIKGNIYKGVIHNIDTNLQAAFVSYGSGKNGFLQIDEVHPEYWLAHHEPTKGKKFPPIQKVLKAGQEVLVQVVKEPTGSKGAFLTTWLSLAGRFLVLTPGQDQIGVSRKVDDDDERSRLREMMNGIDPGQGLGVIVRTVSAGTTKTTLKNDLQYLKRVWRDIRKKATEVSAPSLIYQEPGLSERAVRDYLTEDVSEIWVDNEEIAQSVRETVSLLFPRRKDLVRVHGDLRTPMWERFNLRRQLEQIYSREVLLPSGGRLVFDQTEALMAIDINSGKISGKGNFEAMAHKTNMEAAEAIARHLKLRDIGGQVVIDFIEMRDKKHVLEVEKTLRTAMKNDRARHDVARMSSFGLLELVRQRTGSSALAISLEPCPACGGTGMRRNIEWQSLQALRELRRMMTAETKEKCVFTANPELALYLLNHKRDTLREIEQDYGKCLEIVVRP